MAKMPNIAAESAPNAICASAAVGICHHFPEGRRMAYVSQNAPPYVTRPPSSTSRRVLSAWSAEAVSVQQVRSTDGASVVGEEAPGDGSESDADESAESVEVDGVAADEGDGEEEQTTEGESPEGSDPDDGDGEAEESDGEGVAVAVTVTVGTGVGVGAGVSTVAV